MKVTVEATNSNWRYIYMAEEKGHVSPQSLGGKARAEALTHNEKAGIARSGGNARADKLSSEKQHNIAVQGGKAAHGE